MINDELRAPTALLEARAAAVSEQTGGVVTAQVRGERDPYEEKWADNFYLVGESIGYNYALFAVQFPLDLFYPARVGYSGWPARWREIGDEAQLALAVNEIMGDEKTRAVIAAIAERSRESLSP